MPYSKRHGGPWDRGHADSYYRRGFEPHYYTGATYSTPRVDIKDKDSEEYKAYAAGYADNEAAGDYKDWG
jgi:hypothetical protein